jgi:hypothetical protein
MTIDQTHREFHDAWAHSYDAARNAEAVQAMSHAPVWSSDFLLHHAARISRNLFSTNNQASLDQSAFGELAHRFQPLRRQLLAVC